MRISGWILFLFVSMVLFLALKPVMAVAPQVITKQQAISQAKIFARSIGWKISNALSPTVNPNIFTTNYWDIYFAPPGDKHDIKFYFSVNNTTGRVDYAMDDDALQTARKYPMKNIAFDKVTVLPYVNAFLAKTKVSKAERQLVTNTPWVDPPTGDDVVYWMVEYRRVYQGILFATDGVKFCLNPRDGSLITFKYEESSPLPKTTIPTLTKEMAIAIAEDYLFKQKQVHSETVEESQLLIETRLNEITRQPESYLSWNILLTWHKDANCLGVRVDDQKKVVTGKYFEVTRTQDKDKAEGK